MKIEGYIGISENSRCGNCGSQKRLLALAIKCEKNGLPYDEIRIACRECYEYSVRYGKLPKVKGKHERTKT